MVNGCPGIGLDLGLTGKNIYVVNQFLVNDSALMDFSLFDVDFIGQAWVGHQGCRDVQLAQAFTR